VVDARAQCSHFLLTLRRIFAHIPGAQPDGRNRRLLAKAYCFFHRLLLFSFLHHHKAKQGASPVLMHKAHCNNAQSEGVGDPG
jgi:hypothetical protein